MFEKVWHVIHEHSSVCFEFVNEFFKKNIKSSRPSVCEILCGPNICSWDSLEVSTLFHKRL